MKTHCCNTTARQARLETLKNARLQAQHLFNNTGMSTRAVRDAFEQHNKVKLPIGTVAAIRRGNIANDHDAHSKLLNPSLHRPGRKHVLSMDEPKILKEHAKKDGAEGRA